MHVPPVKRGRVENGIHTAILEALKPDEPTTVLELLNGLRGSHDESKLVHAIFDLLENRKVRRNERGQLLRTESAAAQ
jgi:hypothetical protein